MTTIQFQRIEALLKQWDDRAQACAPGEGHDISRCATEMGELLHGMLNDCLHDDTMQRLSKFLDKEEGKEPLHPDWIYAPFTVAIFDRHGMRRETWTHPKLQNPPQDDT